MVPLTRSAGTTAAAGLPWWRRVLSVQAGDSPTRLRLAGAVTVLCALVLSIGGWYSIDRRADAIDDTAESAEQLIRVQDVRVLVVQADSLAAGAYLVGGQEPPEQRAEYGDRIAGAATGLVDASHAAAAGDVEALQRAGAQLGAYTGLVEQARANNRQGFPVGAAYQRQARTVAQDLVATLRGVEANTRSRVNTSMERAHRASWLLVVSSLVLLVVIAVGSWWLAVRWRRLVNVPLAAAGVMALLVLTVGVGVNGRAVSTAGDAVRTPLRAADLLAQARAAGYDARSNEALTLIARGNGDTYDQQWRLSASIVTDAVTSGCDTFGVGCADHFHRYTQGHALIRELDDGGDWDAAVALSTTGTAAGIENPDGLDPVGDFEQFANTTAAELDGEAAAASAAFDDAVAPLGTLQIVVILAGLASAVLAFVGYGQRLREYR